MRKFIFLLAVWGSLKANGQTTYDARIEKLAAEISTSFGKEDKIKIGIGKFTYNDQQTRLTQLIYDDLGSALVVLSTNDKKIVVSSEGKLNAINGYSFANTEADKAISLGKEKSVEYICFGRITEQDDGFKILIKLYETKEGNLISAFKTVLDKAQHLEDLNAVVLKGNKETETVAKTVSTPPSAVLQTIQETTEKVEKEKKPRENKFWKFLGETAVSTGSQVINNTVEKKLGRPIRSIDPGGDSSGDSTGTRSPASTDGECKTYVNFTNKTEDPVIVKVYNEKPDYYSLVKPIYIYTIAAGRSKKQRIDKDAEYFYEAYTDTSNELKGLSKSYNGVFIAEECGEIVTEILE